MTLAELKELDKEVITPAEAAPCCIAIHSGSGRRRGRTSPCWASR